MATVFREREEPRYSSALMCWRVKLTSCCRRERVGRLQSGLSRLRAVFSAGTADQVQHTSFCPVKVM